MNRILGLILFLLSFTATAAVPCHLYEVKGEVKAQKDYFELRVAPGTRSEVRLKIPQLLQSKFFPYVDHFVKVELTIEGEELMRDSVIKKISSVQKDIPDPLNAGEGTYKVNKGKNSCL